MTITRSFKGTFFHAPVCGQIEVLRDVLIRCDDEGRIADIVHPDTPSYSEAVFEDRSVARLETLPDGTYALPGFCDLHIHAPQWPQLGKALDVPLEVWLQKHTFPLEARYSDLGFARRSYEGLVDDLLSNGTTTALYFATQHQDATRLLADICLEKGQRALIGKVAMDNPQECPNFYVESTDAALRGTADFIDYVRGLNTDRIKPVVTPRFIASCTDAALEGLGDLAKRCGCHIQTHCSESDWEHNYVLDRHGMEDTDSLDRFGLLTRHTVLAHANFISEDNMAKISARGAGIAHCPLSNYYFSNAVFPLKRALEKGLRVGLGTDISGGPSASIFDNMRWAVASSRALHDGVDARLHWDNRGLRGSQIDWRTAFHIATKGGAEALDLPVGTFEKGRYFDAQLIDPQAKSGTIRLMDDLDSEEEVLQKIVYTASKANIAKVWVAADCVVG